MATSSGLDPLQEGLALHNAGAYFEAHEELELLWGPATGVDRAFYHGLILISGGCYHFRERNWVGARALLHRGIEELRNVPAGTYRGVVVGKLIADVEQVLSAIDEIEASRRSFTEGLLPQIEYRPEPSSP